MQRNMWLCAGLGMLLVALVVGPGRGAEKRPASLEALPDHPRLFLPAAELEPVKQKLAQNPLLRRAHQRMRQNSDGILQADPVTFEKRGRRLLHKSRKCLSRVLRLAYFYRLSGKRRYLQRAKVEMRAAAGFKHWNPSHFLDVAEMTAALAIGYDWLYPDLSPELRATIRQAIVEKGLKPGLKGGWWVDARNNWGQVCHGGLTLGALAVAEHHPKLAKRTIRRALKQIKRPMDAYGPQGGYPEGPGYWGYGSSFNVILIDALQSALGRGFGLPQHQAFMKSAEYYLHMHGPSGHYFNYSDSGRGGGVSPAVFWFAKQRNQPSLLWQELQALKQYAANGGAGPRLMPLLFVWAGDLDAIKPPAQRHRRFAGKTPVAVHRSAWSRQATFVGLKAGTPRANHGHMDIGSFVMAADGVRWAVDLGPESYHKLESAGVDLWNDQQDSERWDIFRLNNKSHNTLMVNGQNQRVDGKARIIRFSDDKPNPHTVIDMSAVYKNQLQTARRGVMLLPDQAVLVQDEVAAPDDQPATVRWAMMTRAKVRINSAHRATLSQQGRSLQLRVAGLPNTKLTTFSTKPDTDYEDANKGTTMVGFKIELPAGANQRWRIRLLPTGDNADQATAPQGRSMPSTPPLLEWSSPQRAN
jgi:hypothetical protein